MRPAPRRGCSISLPNAHVIAVTKALSIAGDFTPSAAAKFAFGMLERTLVRAFDERGRPYIAAPADVTGRAGGIVRRHARRAPDQWMVRSISEIACWLTCWRENGRPAVCTAAAIEALRQIDPNWPDLIRRMEAALTAMPTTTARPFELTRLPAAASRLIAALRRAE
jgi:hypothetical protein